MLQPTLAALAQGRCWRRPLERPGCHLYSINLPPGGVHGLGIPTVVSVRDSLRVTGSPDADVPASHLRIQQLNVELPVYPDGPVTATAPVAVPPQRDGRVWVRRSAVTRASP
jgi:hypothetical protein